MVSSHAGRCMSIVTTRSERCASSGSMGNSSGTRYPLQSKWSSAVPHRETSHKSSAVNPIGPQPPPQRLEGKMPHPEEVNLGDFEADDSNTERDGRVATHHQLEPQGPISSLPLSLLWPRALLRAGPREVFLSTTRGHVCVGSPLHTDLGACDLLDHVALMAPIQERRGVF